MTTQNPNVEPGQTQTIQSPNELTCETHYENDDYLRVGHWWTRSLTPVQQRNEHQWQLETCKDKCYATIIYSEKNFLAVKFKELVVLPVTHEVEMSKSFEEIVEQIAAQLSQALRPFQVREVDATRKAAIIRTQPRTMTFADTYAPRLRGFAHAMMWDRITNSIVGEVRYMELVIKDNGQRVLRQFAFKEQRKRYHREMIMTYETLSHVLDAIAHPFGRD